MKLKLAIGTITAIFAAAAAWAVEYTTSAAMAADVSLANMPDMSNMRNKLAFDFAASIGVLAMESTWVDVVVNGRFDGLYQLCEHIRVAEDRVDVFDWEGYSEDNDHTAGHRSWLDEQFATVPTLMESVRCDAQTSPWDGVALPEPTRLTIR